MNGSLGWSPTCGGVLRPDEPTTQAGFPSISTVATVPIVSGAENGIGGAGDGAPRAAGIRWIGQMPVIWSPITIAGAPIVRAQFSWITEPSMSTTALLWTLTPPWPFRLSWPSASIAMPALELILMSPLASMRIVPSL